MSQFTTLQVPPMYWGQTITIDGGDIRYLRSPIGFAAQSWQTGVQNTLRKIETSETGKLFMKLMNNPSEIKGRCKIVPIDADSPGRTSTLPESWEKSVAKGTNFDCRSESLCNGTRPAGAPNQVVGEGTGSDVFVKYHPDSWRIHDVRAGMDNEQDKYQPDDVLLHELVHAYQVMRGGFSVQHAPKDSFMHYEEEFYAITIANMHVSESGRIEALRADHGAEHNHLSAWQAYPPHFASDNEQLIEKMCQAFPESFIFELSHLTAPTFNPLRYRREKLENPDADKPKIFSY